MVVRILRRVTIFVLSMIVSSILVFAFLAACRATRPGIALGVNAIEEAVAALRRSSG